MELEFDDGMMDSRVPEMMPEMEPRIMPDNDMMTGNLENEMTPSINDMLDKKSLDRTMMDNGMSPAPHDMAMTTGMISSVQPKMMMMMGHMKPHTYQLDMTEIVKDISDKVHMIASEAINSDLHKTVVKASGLSRTKRQSVVKEDDHEANVVRNTDRGDFIF